MIPDGMLLCIIKHQKTCAKIGFSSAEFINWFKQFIIVIKNQYNGLLDLINSYKQISANNLDINVSYYVYNFFLYYCINLIKIEHLKFIIKPEKVLN